MPLRVYDNNAWQSPTSIRIYNDSEWKTASVGYVYDMGVWRVVFPDPIIPSITSIFAGAFGDRYEVNWEVRLINCDYVEAYLYSGTTQNNLLSTQTIQIDENSVVDTRIEFGGLQNNTTYNIKLIGYSITQNTTTVFSGPITTTNVIIPTVNITSMTPSPDLSSVQINWTSTNQYDYEISVWSVSDGVRRFGPIFATPPLPNNNQSYTATFQQQPNTQYRVDIRVYSNSIDTAEDSDFYTTPSTPAPSYNNFIVSGATCNSLTVSWNAQNYTSGTIEIWTTIATPERVPGKGSLVESHSFTSLSSRTFTGLNPSTQYAFTLILNGTTTITSDYLGSFGSILPSLTGNTLNSSVNTPTNFTGSSNFYGSGATLSWSAATGNCTSVSGYNVQYKLSSSETWLSLVNGITATSVNTTLYVTLTANTSYDFRVQATGSGADSSGYATTTLVTNNNPYSITVTPANSSMTTFSSLSFTAQLKNISGVDISQSGVSVTWSSSTLSGSSFSTNPSTTNSLGQASTTFNTSSSAGFVTITAQALSLTGTPGGSTGLTVSLSAGLKPNLTGSGTTRGVSFSNSNHSSLYTYNASPGYPSTGSLESGDSYNNSQFDILITRTRSARNTISKSGNTATTTNPTFDANPLVSMRISSSRTGYTSVDSDISSVFASTSITGRAYQWQQFTNSTWNTNFGAAFSGINSQTLSWSSTGFTSRQIRCLVTTNFSSGQSDISTSENVVTIP